MHIVCLEVAQWQRSESWDRCTRFVAFVIGRICKHPFNNSCATAASAVAVSIVQSMQHKLLLCLPLHLIDNSY